MRRRAAVLMFSLLLAGLVMPAPAEVPQVTLELAPTQQEPPVWHVGRPVPLRVVLILPPGYQAIAEPRLSC